MTDVVAEGDRLDRAASRGGRAFGAMQVPVFRVIWTSFALAQLGFWIAFLALQGLMLDLTDGDGVWLGLLFFANFIPMLVITTFAGALADRVDRIRILQVGHGVIAALAVGLAALGYSGALTPALVIPFSFGIGVVFAVTAPANQAIVVEAVPPDRMASAISMQSLAGNLCRVVGPAIAGVILTVASAPLAILVYGVVSVVVVWWLRRIELPEPDRTMTTGSYRSMLADGLRHARTHWPVLPALVVLAVSSLSAGAYLAILPIVADDVFDRGATGLSVLSMVTGVGSAIGAILTGVLGAPVGLRATLLPLLLFGASFVVFGLAPNWWTALGAVALVGFSYFWSMTALNTLVQQATGDTMRGRVMALFTVAWGGMVPVGALWQGVAAGVVGVRATVVTCGVITLLAALVPLVTGTSNRPTPAAAR